MRTETADWAWNTKRLVDRSDPSQRDPIIGASTAWMFIEDIHLQSAAFRYRRSERVTIALRPNDPALAEQIQGILSRYGRSHRSDIGDVIGEFIEQVCQSLAHYGEIGFELLRNPDPTGSPRFVLNPIYGPKVYRLFGWALQPVSKDPERGPAGLARVRACDFWRLRLPREFGSPRRHRRLVEVLRVQSKLAPDFYLEDIQAAAKTGFDFEHFKTSMHVDVARATRAWGWPGRSMWSEESLEYYQIMRHLRFREATCRVVMHVVAEFNDLLRREALGCEIVIEGLPEQSEFDRVRTQLRAGEISFADAIGAVDID